MRIIACIKASPEAEDIEVKRDRSLGFDKAAIKVGAYDLNAIEAARQLADAVQGEVVGLSVGGSALANSKLRKDVLSRGLDRLVTVSDDSYADADTYQTAVLLRQALTSLGEWDLVLLGAGSSDVYAQMVGNELGALLGLPVLNAVNKITPQGDRLIVERALEDQVQVLEVDLPAVLSVTSSINTPRIAGMKEILAAGKKPVTQAAGTPPPATIRIRSTLAPEQMERRLTVVEGDTTDVAAQLAAYLKTL
jgi:electron transfer flavoprotein beta subunit